MFYSKETSHDQADLTILIAFGRRHLNISDLERIGRKLHKCIATQ